MDAFLYVTQLLLTALFAFLIGWDTVWMGRIVRYLRGQEGWSDDLGWVFCNCLAAAFCLTSMWADNDWVYLIGFALYFGVRHKRRAAIQRAWEARQQHHIDAALTEAAADAETGDPGEQGIGNLPTITDAQARSLDGLDDVPTFDPDKQETR